MTTIVLAGGSGDLGHRTAAALVAEGAEVRALVRPKTPADKRAALTALGARTSIQATSILNGAFADMLTGEAPIVLHTPHKVLYWGHADQPLDFTTKDDVARYTAKAALDATTPRILRIAGSVVTARSLAETMTSLTGTTFRTWRAGGIGLLSLVIRIARALDRQRDQVFSAWAGMQYLRDMTSGRGKLQPLDNDRYGEMRWTSARDVLARAS